VPALDDRIDELYQLPLSEFVAARTALAKSLDKEAARQVKALQKPTVVPWAVNQLFWSARPVYDALMKSGAALRKMQLSSLKGHRVDVRETADAHKEAVRAAVREAERLAAKDGAHPDRDALARTFEALSLTADAPPDPPGRLIAPLQPPGFEALAGVAIKAPPPREREQRPAPQKAERESAAGRAAEERRLREEAATRERQRAEAIQKAERELEQTRAHAAKARLAWEKAQADVASAEERLKEVRK